MSRQKEEISGSEDRDYLLQKQKEKQMKGKKEKKRNLRYLRDTIKHANIHIMGVPEREEGKGQKQYLNK